MEFKRKRTGIKSSDMPYYYIFLFFLLLSCGGGSPQNREKSKQQTASVSEDIKYINSIKINTPEKDKLYSYNEEVVVSLENDNEKYPLDSVIVYLNGKPVASLGKEEYNYSFKLPETKTGRNQIRVIGWHSDKSRSIANVAIRVKPDFPPKQYRYEIVNTFPHDPKAYTQGLIYHNGYMYEGTGQYGESTLRKTEVSSGKILSVLSIDRRMFGEGITIYNDKIYQITWRSRKGFIYDLKTFSLESTFSYNTEGWGITTMGDKLIMSDGSNKLYHVAPSTFNIIKEVEVYDNKGEVNQINELEYINGLIWANVWLTDRIIAIDPETGAVKGELHLPNLLTKAEQSKIDLLDDVLNGIAYNPEKDTYYITGKRWPKLFEIKIKE